jgi:hypothetical protein
MVCCAGILVDAFEQTGRALVKPVRRAEASSRLSKSNNCAAPPAPMSSLNFRKPAVGNDLASNESYQMVNLYWRI